MSKATRRPRAVLYSRLSRESFVSTSIAGQREDLFAVAERQGWEIVEVFVDSGKSGGKQRANAEEALRMVRDGEADVLAVYAWDRYSRLGLGYDGDVIRVFEDRAKAARRGAAPAALLWADREGIRSDQEGWQMKLAFASELARGERDRMVARRTASIERMRREGRNPGNGPAPWGYRSAAFEDGRPGRRFVPDPEEAAVIRECAERLVAGETATSLARDLKARRIPAPRSDARLAILRGEDPAGLSTGNWSSSRISQLMQSQHLLGRVTVKTTRAADAGADAKREGQLVLGDDGRPLQAHEPILDLQTFLALGERFARGQGRGRQIVRKAARLGSGLVFCGLCGGKAYVVSSRGESAYRCSSQARGAHDCPGLRVKAEIVEAAMEAEYLSLVGDLPAIQYVTEGGSERVQEIAEVTEALMHASQAMIQPGADVAQLSTTVAALQAQRERLAALPSDERTVAVRIAPTWADAWEDANLIERRRYLADAFDHFVIYRADAPRRVVGVVIGAEDPAHAND